MSGASKNKTIPIHTYTYIIYVHIDFLNVGLWELFYEQTRHKERGRSPSQCYSFPEIRSSRSGIVAISEI